MCRNEKIRFVKSAYSQLCLNENTLQKNFAVKKCTLVADKIYKYICINVSIHVHKDI